MTTKIQRSDLKIFPSERLTDNDNGGGLALGTPIKGVANELFDPISSIARVNGSFHARLIYAGVQRHDDEPLIGAFCAITKPPKDPFVSYLLFPATKFGEMRSEIIKRIEAYSVGTIESRMTLLSTQSANSSIVQAYQRVGEPLPLVGDVYCLRQDKQGYPNVEQYIQVTKVSSERRTFNVDNKVFDKTVVKMEISNKLNHDFVGVDYPVDGYANPPCKIRETHVADAGRYYGVKPIVNAIEPDSQKIQVSAIMEKIVPVNQIETALVDMVAGQTTINIETAYTDVVINGIRQTTIKPIKAHIHSSKEDITLANRSYNHTAQLINPKAGSVVAKFLAQGTWYELKDDGNGKLIGASQRHGSGSINYQTGSVVITCGELPDVNSAIVVNYNKDIYQKPNNPTLDCYLPIKMQGIGTDITITSGTKTANVVSNQITGDFDGMFDLASQTLKINPKIGKDEIVVNYQSGNPISQTIDDGQNQFTLTQTPIRPHSLSFLANYQFNHHGILFSCQDDGNGNITSDDGQTIGTVNYQTGAVTINQTHTKQDFSPIFERKKVGSRRIYQNHDTSKAFTTEDVFDNVWTGSTRTETDYQLSRVYQLSYLIHAHDKTERFHTPNLTIDIKTDSQYLNIVDDTLCFTLGNQTYQEMDKQIYLNGQVVGSRTDNQMVLTDFTPFDNKQTSVKALLVQTQSDGIKHLTFTTPKLRRKSLKLNIDNQPVNASLQGQIASYGYVDTEAGLVMLDFQSEVSDITWQAVALSYLPVASSVVKIDTVRLPQDGRVPIFRNGDTILISNTIEQNLGSAFTGGQTVLLDRQDLDRICLQDSNGKPVLATLWDYDLTAGSITFKPSLDLSDYQMPLVAKHTQEERNLIVNVDIDGTLTLRFATKRAYPVENTYVSSVLIHHKNLQVSVSVPFTQRSWNNQWQDTPNGEPLLNRLKLKDYPIILTDDGAITERWVIIFKSSSQFELYGETLGFVMRTDTLQDLAPINPATNKPYFTMDKRAFGADTPWAVQDVIRFNTTGTLMPVWVLCAVQPTANPLNEEDGFTVCLFGDTVHEE